MQLWPELTGSSSQNDATTGCSGSSHKASLLLGTGVDELDFQGRVLFLLAFQEGCWNQPASNTGVNCNRLQHELPDEAASDLLQMVKPGLAWLTTKASPSE